MAKLAKSMLDRQGTSVRSKRLNSLLRQANVPVTVYDRDSSHEEFPDEPQPLLQHILELYFIQILHLESASLDFRLSTLRRKGTQLFWMPSPVAVKWQPEFIAAIREMYRGFYQEDSPGFVTALKALGIGSSERILIRHFGENQTCHKFSLSDFKDTFHEVFMAAKRERQRIHPQFLPFGLGLVTLYQCLERSQQPYDVKAAYFCGKRLLPT
jgi:hypothetical protein